MAGGDGLGHRGHTHRVGAQGAEHADFRRRLVAGTAVHGVHALPELDARLGGQGLELFPEISGIDVAHIREPGPQLVQIGPGQRVGSGEIDVIAQEHQSAGPKVQVHPAGGVGEHDGPSPQPGHEPHRQGGLLGRVALVAVDPAPQGGHPPAPAGAQEEGPGVSLHRRDGEAGNIPKGDFHRLLQPVAEIPQPAAQHQAQLRPEVRLFPHVAVGAGEPLLHRHSFFSFTSQSLSICRLSRQSGSTCSTQA